MVCLYVKQQWAEATVSVIATLPLNVTSPAVNYHNSSSNTTTTKAAALYSQCQPLVAGAH